MEELSVFEPQPDGSFEHHYLSFEKMEELLNEYLTAKVRGENITPDAHGKTEAGRARTAPSLPGRA